MNLKSLTSVEIDTHLAKALDTQIGYQMDIARIQVTIARYRKALAEGGYSAYNAEERIADNEAELEILESHLGETEDLISALNREFAVRGGWNRFYIVKNSNGHVHSSMRCGSCNKNGNATAFGWLYEQAGKTEAEIVELAGNGACTFCFPTAPVTTRPNQLELPEVKEAREAREAKKAAADAVKIAKGITNPDGTELREIDYVGARDGKTWRGSVIKTERTAQIMAVDAIANVRLYGYQPQPELVGRIVEALAHKRDESVESVLAMLQAKADKKK